MKSSRKNSKISQSCRNNRRAYLVKRMLRDVDNKISKKKKRSKKTRRTKHKIYKRKKRHTQKGGGSTELKKQYDEECNSFWKRNWSNRSGCRKLKSDIAEAETNEKQSQSTNIIQPQSTNVQPQSTNIIQPQSTNVNQQTNNQYQ